MLEVCRLKQIWLTPSFVSHWITLTLGRSDNSVIGIHIHLYTPVNSSVFFSLFTPYTETFDWLNNYSLIGSHI